MWVTWPNEGERDLRPQDSERNVLCVKGMQSGVYKYKVQKSTISLKAFSHYHDILLPDFSAEVWRSSLKIFQKFITFEL